MLTMSYMELFNIGKSFESSVGEGTKLERLRIPKNMSRINLHYDEISFLESFNKEINFLVSGEIWCPDFQLNISVLKKFCDINHNFNISVITMGRGKKYLSQLLNIDKDSLKYPTIAVLDKNFDLIGVFFERPQVVINQDFESIKLDYYKGKYLSDTCMDIISILKNSL